MKKLLFLLSSVFLVLLSFSASAQTTATDSAKIAVDTSIVPASQVMPSPQFDLYNYLAVNTKFPAMERADGKSGIVYVSFVVEKDGSISDVHVEKGVEGAPGFDREAVRVISAMPKWNPGKINDKPVRVKIIQPVRFVNDVSDPHKKKKKHSQ